MQWNQIFVDIFFSHLGNYGKETNKQLFVKSILLLLWCLLVSYNNLLPLNTIFRVNFDLEHGIVGQNADFKESQKKLEWHMKKATSHALVYTFCIYPYN